jgi:uncharacterized membrane protein
MAYTSKPTKQIDLADVEHIAALVAGGLLYVCGTRKDGVPGILLKAAGLGFMWRGQQGYRSLYEALGFELPQKVSGIGKVNEWAKAEVIVERPREELYRIWRNFENLPVFMDHLVSVHEVTDRHSVWVARAPLGTVIKWDALIINDIENELIAWETLEGSGVDHAGSIHFDPLGDEITRVRVKLRYDPPADRLGILLARAFHLDPQREIQQDLRRFKAIMEVGRKTALATSLPLAKVI